MGNRDAMRVGALVAAFAVLTVPVLAGFAGTDLFLPMAGRGVGAYPANWFTTVYLYNPNPAAVAVDLSFLERNRDNVANPPPTVTETLAPGETRVFENIVETTFARTGTVYGAIRIHSASEVVATSRVFSKESESAPLTQSFGQDFAAIPAAFAIGLGESTQILGGYTTQPYQDSQARFNIGCVETTGAGSATVHWVARDGDGVERAAYDRQVPRLSQTQGFFHDYFTGVDLTNARISATVTAGSGRVLCYGSLVTNDRTMPKPVQDPTTFEMVYADELLGIDTVQHDATLTGDGTAAAPLGIAAGGVGTTQVAAAAITPDRIAPSATVGQVLTTVAAGAGSPVETMSLAGNAVAWQTPATGDITEVVAGTGLDGGGAEGSVRLDIEVPLRLEGDPGAVAPGDARGLIMGTNTAADGAGVTGIATATAVGVIGRSRHGYGMFALSEQGTGLNAASMFDTAVRAQGQHTGVEARAETSHAVRALLGADPPTFWTPAAVLGWTRNADGVIALSETGTGVKGVSTAGTGVYAESQTGIGLDVKARLLAIRATSGGGTAIQAIVGEMPSIMPFGDTGVVAIASQGTGIVAEGGGAMGYGISATGPRSGVLGYSDAGAGVSGHSVTDLGVVGTSGDRLYGGSLPSSAGVLGASLTQPGVWGGSAANTGVWGRSGIGMGVYGQSDEGYGVVGHSGTTDSVYGSTATSGAAGVLGEHFGTWAGVEGSCDNGSGVYGRTTVGSAVHGYASSTGRAGFFRGKVEIQGNLTKSSGSFRIDHPLDPANRYLSHSFVESPDMMNVYNGNVVTDEAGEAVVELPEWFEALNRDFRYQLTPIGGAAPNLHIAEKMADRRFRIAGATPGLEVSWQVTGIRRDPWAREHPIVVEEDKPEDERGYYLHPELYGLDDTASTNAMTRAEAAGGAPETAAAAAAPVDPERRGTGTAEDGAPS